VDPHPPPRKVSSLLSFPRGFSVAKLPCLLGEPFVQTRHLLIPIDYPPHLVLLSPIAGIQRTYRGEKRFAS
jgi:hypothetical protein